MMNLSFSERLNIILNEMEVTPDTIYAPNDGEDIAFIYNLDGSIFYGEGKSHQWIYHKYKDYYKNMFDPITNEPVTRYGLETNNLALLGRCGYINNYDDKIDHSKHYVAFWNENSELYDKLLGSCLEQLLDDGLITQNTLLSIPYESVTRVGDTKRQVRTEPDDEQKEKLALARQLHLMGPEEKKAAMLKLGLSPYGKKNEWQSGSEEANLVKPGQKWWAATSESIL